MAGVAFATLTAGSLSAGPSDRTLKLFNVHTGERATITYMKNGRLDPKGVEQMNQFLRDWRRNEARKMDPRLFDVIWQAYQEAGSKDYIHIISSYRSPNTNEMLRKRSRGVAKNSQHTLGKAMDFFMPDVPLAKIREIGLRMQAGGVGFYPTSGSPFVHLDVGSVRHWPRMTRQQLVKVFPNGGTVHVPSDGKPLPGYQAALAAYKARQASGAIAVADISGDEEGDETVETVVAVAAPAAPGIMAPLPRRRPAIETVVAAVAASETIAAAPAIADIASVVPVEGAEAIVADLSLNVPLPRPAPVTSRAMLAEAAPAAALDGATPAEISAVVAAADVATPAVSSAEITLAAAEPVSAEPVAYQPLEQVVAEAAMFGQMVPLPRPAPVTSRASLASDPLPSIAPSRPAFITASLDTSDAATMAQARARAIAAIRAQLLRQDGVARPDPIGSAVMAFASTDMPLLRATTPEPVMAAPDVAAAARAELQGAPETTMITGSIPPLPRARPALPEAVAVASLTPPALTTAPAGWPASIAAFVAPVTPAAAAPAIVRAPLGAIDPLATLTMPTGDPQDLGAFTRPGSTRQMHFATLVTGDAEHLPQLLVKPNRSLAITFTGFVYDGLRTDRFAGRAVAPLATVNLARPDGYYVTAGPQTAPNGG